MDILACLCGDELDLPVCKFYYIPYIVGAEWVLA